LSGGHSRPRGRPHTCSLSIGTPVLSARGRANLASEGIKLRNSVRIGIWGWQTDRYRPNPSVQDWSMNGRTAPAAAVHETGCAQEGGANGMAIGLACLRPISWRCHLPAPPGNHATAKVGQSPPNSRPGCPRSGRARSPPASDRRPARGAPPRPTPRLPRPAWASSTTRLRAPIAPRPTDIAGARLPIQVRITARDDAQQQRFVADHQVRLAAKGGGSAGKMADVGLICPPPIPAFDHPAHRLGLCHGNSSGLRFGG
jgi:hypothetical protein